MNYSLWFNTEQSFRRNKYLIRTNFVGNISKYNLTKTFRNTFKVRYNNLTLDVLLGPRDTGFVKL